MTRHGNFCVWVIKQSTRVFKNNAAQNDNKPKYWGRERGPCGPTSDAYGLSFNVTSTQQLKRRATSDVWSRGRSYIVSFHLSYSSINTYLYTNWMIGKIQMAHNKSFNWNNRLYTSTWNDFYGILAGQLAQRFCMHTITDHWQRQTVMWFIGLFLSHSHTYIYTQTNIKQCTNDVYNVWDNFFNYKRPYIYIKSTIQFNTEMCYLNYNKS